MKDSKKCQTFHFINGVIHGPKPTLLHQSLCFTCTNFKLAPPRDRHLRDQKRSNITKYPGAKTKGKGKIHAGNGCSHGGRSHEGYSKDFLFEVEDRSVYRSCSQNGKKLPPPPQTSPFSVKKSSVILKEWSVNLQSTWFFIL